MYESVIKKLVLKYSPRYGQTTCVQIGWGIFCVQLYPINALSIEENWVIMYLICFHMV